MKHWTMVAATAVMIATGVQARDTRWTPAWGSSQVRVEGANADRVAKAGPVTIRQIVRLTASGRVLRLRLSNVAGTTPLHIGAASIGLAAPGRSDVAKPLAGDLHSPGAR